MEHITTADAVEFLDRFSNVSATVTLHHLLITLDDVIGGLMKPDLFCKPIAKTPRDREALRDAVFSGHEAAAGRCAHRRAAVKISKTHAFCGHAVDVRRLNNVLTVASQLGIPQVIRHNKNDIGRKNYI